MKISYSGRNVKTSEYFIDNQPLGYSYFDLFTELMDKVSNDIYMPDIISIDVRYNDNSLWIRVTYLD